MRNLLLIIFMVIPFFANSQNLKEYTASNGITYRVGDIINLNSGSAPNGDFVYLSMGGWAVSIDASQNVIGKVYAGLAVSVKKIKTARMKGAEKIYFTVGGGNITNYILDIEGAIMACEVGECKEFSSESPIIVSEESALDRLKKLKELLDMGAITQEEYDEQKAKILKEL